MSIVEGVKQVFDGSMRVIDGAIAAVKPTPKPAPAASGAVLIQGKRGAASVGERVTRIVPSGTPKLPRSYLGIKPVPSAVDEFLSQASDEERRAFWAAHPESPSEMGGQPLSAPSQLGKGGSKRAASQAVPSAPAPAAKKGCC